MSFFDKLKQTAATATAAASNAANVAVKQTKTAAAIGKVKLAIAGEQDKMKKAYTELGRIYFRDYETQAEAELEEYLPWLDKCTEAKEKIAALNEELAALKAEAAKKAEPIVEESVAEDEEDTSIYVDFAEAEPVVEIVEEEVPEIPAEEPAPTVGTLYVDISGQE